MVELEIFISRRDVARLFKLLAIIEELGGVATTDSVRAAGIGSGAPDISKWGIPSILKKNRALVSERPSGWMLLPAGRSQLAALGFVKSSDTPVKVKQHAECIAIGHGHSGLWKDLRDFLRDKYECEVIEFNSRSAVGMTVIARLEEMLSDSTMAFLVATAEDEQADGQLRARQNVVHEAGLFQGRHGFHRAVVLFEDGCEGFSNIAGLGYIKFAPGNIMSASEDLRSYLGDRIKLPLR